MKKQLITLLVTCSVLLPCMSAGAVAQKITLNDTTLEIPTEMGRIQERDDRTFVPVRFVSEHLGCTVNYNDIQKSATITDSNNVSLLITQDSEYLFTLPNVGEPKLYMMDTKAFVDDEDQRLYLPIRFLAEAFGYTVGWDATTETVSLTRNAE